MKKKVAESKAAKNGFLTAEVLLFFFIIYRWLVSRSVVRDLIITFVLSIIIYFTCLLYFENYKK